MTISLGDVVTYFVGDKTKFDKTLRDVERDVQGFGSRIGGFLSNSLSHLTGNILTSAISKVTQAVGSLAQGMVGGNTAFEQYQTQFQVLIGNTELAQQRMEELADFGARTPFELPGVVEADRVLQGFGLHAADVAARFGKSGDEIRTIAGDVAAGVGQPFQEISALIGRFSAGATGEAISRMQELGITTRKELSTMGLEFDKSGQLVSPLDEAMTVLLQVMEERFGGMMDAQSKTFGGMLSNFQDWAAQVTRTLGAPIFDVLKDALAAFLDFVKPGSPADNVIKQFAETIRLTLGVLGEIGQALVGDVAGQIDSFVQKVGQGLEQVNAFLRQLKDEIAGLTAGDILAELGPGLEALHSQMQTSLDQLAATHETTLNSLEGQIEQAGERMGQAMAGIAEKYGPKIIELQERIAETTDQWNERLTDSAETHAKRRQGIENQIAKAQSDMEEKLTQLKKDHMRRRQQLTMSLLLAETEEQYLAIQNQIKAEDDKFKDESDKTRAAAKERTDTLKAQLDEEDKEHAKQQSRLEKQRDKALGDLQKQLDEVKGKRAEEEAEIQATYNAEVDLLNKRIAAENAAYTQQQEELKALFQQQMADLEAEINARAAAIGTGPAAQVGAFIRGAIDEFNNLKAAVLDFLEQVTPVQGWVTWAIEKFGELRTTLSELKPTIDELSTSFVEFLTILQTKTQETLTAANQWWEEHKGAVGTVLDFIIETNQNKLDLLVTLWQTHSDAVWQIITLNWETITGIFSSYGVLLTEGLEALAALLEGNWQAMGEHLLNIAEEFWNNVKQSFATAKEGLGVIVGEIIETVRSKFEGLNLFQTGKNMIDGLINGFKSGMGTLKNLMSQAVTSSTQAAEEAGEIKSPSKLTARKVGGPLAEGIGLGFQERLKAQMAGLKQAVAGSLSGLAPGELAPAAAAAFGSKTTNPTFYQTNNFPPNLAFDKAALLEESKQQSLKLLMQHYEED